ncbi:MAG: hypothetical protein H0W21_06075 [Actinobacteria bacterium]|nr:hypothetical protein [Actinomycetota bacterium]
MDGTQVADDRGTVHGPGEVITVSAANAVTLIGSGLVTKVVQTPRARDKRVRAPKK